MDEKLHVRPLGRFAQFLDWVMRPLMMLLSGVFNEEPQGTHRWNNIHLRKTTVGYLNLKYAVQCKGVPESSRRIPIFFHLPIFGGWKNYVVIAPWNPSRQWVEWHPGWITGDVAGVSRLSIFGPVRLLVGSGDVSFFGVDGAGRQIRVREIGRGRIGGGGLFSKTPLL